MPISKILASVPILRTLTSPSNEQTSRAAAPSSTSASGNAEDTVSVSSPELSAETVSDTQARDIASQIGDFFAESDGAAIGADANKLAQF